MRSLIYNSRNYSILLNRDNATQEDLSTTVEIILYYLTQYIVDWVLYLQQ